MSGDERTPTPQPLTGDELAAIKARAEASAGVAGFATIHYALAREDVPRLVAEVESLRAKVERIEEERRAVDLLDWPGEAHRLQAALNFAKGTIHDLSATVERLEGERA